MSGHSWVGQHKKELLGGAALAALAVGTGGFGLLAAPEVAAGAAGLGAVGAEGAGAAGAAATGSLGAGALGMTTAAPGAAGLFGAAPGMAGGLLGAAEATPAVTGGLAGLDAGFGGGSAAAAFGAAPGAANALAYDPTQLSTPFERFTGLLQGGNVQNGMRAMNLANSLTQQPQGQQQNVQMMPHPQVQSQPSGGGLTPDEQRKLNYFSALGYLNG